jgi:hypothetical protein
MVLQCSHLARDFLDPVKGHDADLGVFQGDRVATVLVVHDAIQANDLARHLKARDLVAAVFGGQAGFEKSRANRIQRSELVPVGEQGGASFDFAPNGDQVVKSVQVMVVQAHGHAQLAQVAVGTGDFDGLWIHGFMQSKKMNLLWIKS